MPGYGGRTKSGGGASAPKATKRISKGDFVTDGMLRGFVVGSGTIGKNIPATIIDIGGGRTRPIPTNQLRQG